MMSWVFWATSMSSHNTLYGKQTGRNTTTVTVRKPGYCQLVRQYPEPTPIFRASEHQRYTFERVMITRELKTLPHPAPHKTSLRGRAAVGYYSMEGYQSAPMKITQNIDAKRVNALWFRQRAARRLGSSPSRDQRWELQNRASIRQRDGDRRATEIQGRSAALVRFGQRVLLTTKNYCVAVDNRNSGTVEVAGFERR